MDPLPLWMDAFFVLPGLLAGYRYGSKLFQRGVRLSAPDAVRSARWIVILGFAFIATNIAFAIIRENRTLSWWFPISLDYYSVPIFWSFNMFAVAFCFSGVTSMAMHERKRLWPLVAALGIFIVPASEYVFRNSPAFWPIELGPAKISMDGVILQSSGSSCVPAACANIARKLGVQTTEAELFALMHTSDAGTTNAQAIYGMRALGIKGTKRLIHDRDPHALHTPAMLVVDMIGLPEVHAVAYMSANGDTFEIHDPRSGLLKMSLGELQKIWQGKAVEFVLP
jgi:hypothetical protein